MLIDRDRDYWTEFYQLKRKIESGKGTDSDYQQIPDLLKCAEASSEMSKHRHAVNEQWG